MIESGVRYHWNLDDVDVRVEEELAQLLDLPPLVSRLLCQRGLAGPDDARSFLQPKLTDLHDPALLPGADRAAHRIVQAVRDRHPIVIYGDYDVDGITASAIIWHMLEMLEADVRCYIPHRIDEGYGLHVDAIEKLASIPGPTPLLVSVDCGVTAIKEAKAASQLGVDLIITDHHDLPTDQLPNAHTLVHPRLTRTPGDHGEPASKYPFADLCGAGVAFKLAWQIARVACGSQRVPQTMRQLLLELMSLAALGTVADVVPLVGENRILTSFGLGRMKQTRFVGLNALIDATRLRDERIDAFHVGFVLGPRLNACGRMGHAGKTLRLLTDVDPSQAASMAKFLTQENTRRRSVERQMLTDAKQMVIDAGFDQPQCRAIVLCHEDWHLGVVGIVAARLVEQFSRPVVLLSRNKEIVSGSARSVPGLHINDAIGHCAEWLDSYGGHAMAAGLRLSSDNVDAFRKDFVAYVNENLQLDNLVTTININSFCMLDQINIDLIMQIQRLAPFGRSNPPPVFCLQDVQLAGQPQCVGDGGQHLRLPIRQNGVTVQAIGFGLGDLADRLAINDRIDIAFEPKISTWQGRRRCEVHIKDFRFAEVQSAV